MTTVPFGEEAGTHQPSSFVPSDDANEASS